MARNLIRFSGGEHAVVDQTVSPPLWSGFLTESPYEAKINGAVALPGGTLATYSLTACNSPETADAIASATILQTQ